MIALAWGMNNVEILSHYASLNFQAERYHQFHNGIGEVSTHWYRYSYRTN